MQRRIHLWGQGTEFYIASDDDYFDDVYEVREDCSLYIEFSGGSTFRADLVDGLWMIWPSNLILYGSIECTKSYDLDTQSSDAYILNSKETAVTVMESANGRHRIVVAS